MIWGTSTLQLVTPITAALNPQPNNRDEMKVKAYIWRGMRYLAAAIAVFVLAYACDVGLTWYQYGHVQQTAAEGTDALLDSLLPTYDVARRQHVRVSAPAQIAFAAGCEMNLQQSVIVRAILRIRALVLGSEPEKKKTRPLGLVEQARVWGWGELAEDPGREIVFGAVTQPWAPNPVFRALPVGEFRRFQEPGFVKIVWMLRVDPIEGGKSVVSTETRVATADPVSRAKFRRYFSWASPGMFLIRWISLRAAKDEAERRVPRADTNWR
ncbi:MAG TPA: hypothetical protein VEI01_03690 [Terriglobales bacterium]|nr:hypothetical protein [Terriglobales bacterium]